LPIVNVLESTLEWTKGAVIVNSGIGSHPYTMVFFGFGLGVFSNIVLIRCKIGSESFVIASVVETWIW
jgi:hypothetical protein